MRDAAAAQQRQEQARRAAEQKKAEEAEAEWRCGIALKLHYGMSEDASPAALDRVVELAEAAAASKVYDRHAAGKNRFIDGGSAGGR
jgi:hypothetical protein